MNLRSIDTLIPLLMLACSQTALAESTDSQQPLQMQADRLFVHSDQQAEFDGKVELTQGSLEIRADKIVLKQDAMKHKNCVATGSPARFRQRMEGSDQYVEGYGQRIVYDTRTETVDFFGQARVKRAQDDVKGDHISYSTRSETFQVLGDPAHAGDPEKGRAHAVIQTGKPARNAPPPEQPASSPGQKP